MGRGRDDPEESVEDVYIEPEFTSTTSKVASVGKSCWKAQKNRPHGTQPTICPKGTEH